MDEEALLQQIRELLEQYLALGSDTPVAPEVEALINAIQTNSGGPEAQPMGLDSPDGDIEPMGQDLGPDPMAPAEGEPPANPTAKTFGEANLSALPRLKKRNEKK